MKRLTLLLLALASGLLFAGCDDAGDDAVSKFNVLSERVNQDAAARENIIVMVEASSDVTWSASVPEADASWLKLVKTGGTGIGRVIFSLEANASIETRTTTLTVTGTTRDGRHPIGSSSVIVAQLGAAPSILIEPAGSVSLPADAVGAYTVAVTANLAWKAEVSILSGGEGWITVTAPDATVAGSGEAVLSIAANETENAREAVLRIVHAADAELFAELSILQMRAPARYDLTIEGMDGTLPLGAATLLIAPAEGENLTRTGNVAVLDGSTSISYDEPLPEGEYTLVSVTPEGAGAVYLGGRFSIGAESVCTAMEHWYPVFESFGGESAEHPLRIAKPAHLLGLATTVNAGSDYAGFHFRQVADISLAGYDDWVGIGSAACKFAGAYDGDGHRITGLAIASEGPEVVEGFTCGHALFRHVGGTDADHRAEIRNLTVEGAVTGAAGYVGGIVAHCADFTLVGNCESRVALTVSASGAGNAGGIVSLVAGGGVTLENCVNRGEITVRGSGTVNNLGGVAGQATGVSEESRVLLSGCRNYGKITYQGNSGGVLGFTTGNIDLVRCANYGEMVKTGTTVVRIGGLVGSLQGDATLRESFNLGRIDGYRHTGGLVGWCQNAGSVENCYNRGEIVAQGSTGNTGGLVGNINTDGFVVKNCYNVGLYTPFSAADANRYAAIAGSGGSNTSGVEGCYYETDKGMAGGLGRGAKKNPVDVAGQAEVKDNAWFVSGAPIDGWNTSVWTFTPGGYPSLTNNPEQL